jgi:hypothetical protein
MRVSIGFMAIAISMFWVNCAYAQQEEEIADSTLVFSYDAGGNVIRRKVEIINVQRKRRKADSLHLELKNVHVFPNPVGDVLNIEGHLPEDVKRADYTVMSMNGQLVMKGAYDGEAQRLPVKGLANGVYILDIRAKEYSSTYKIVVNHH